MLGKGISESCELEVREMVAGGLRSRPIMDDSRMSIMYCGSLFGDSKAFWSKGVSSGGTGDVGVASR